MTSPNSRRSRRVMPPVMVSLITELSCDAASRGLSSGQTIGAARTDVRSACCLPELRGANRLRRLYPLDDGELFKFNLKSSVCQRQTGLPKGNPPCVFPSFPPAPLRFRLPKQIDKSMRTASPTSAPELAHQAPPGRDFLTAELPRADVGMELSSGQPISTARTATRCICRLLYPQSYSEKNERAFRAASPVPALELAKATGNASIGAPSPCGT